MKTWFIRLVSINWSVIGNQAIMYRFSGNANGIHSLTNNIPRVFNEHGFYKVRAHRYCSAIAVSAFRVKITSSKSLETIADGRNSRTTSPINGVNFVCSILYVMKEFFFKQYASFSYLH